MEQNLLNAIAVVIIDNRIRSYHRQKTMITARQRLAQRALRSLDLAPSPPPLNPLSSSSNGTSSSNDPDHFAQLALASPVALVQKHGFNVDLNDGNNELPLFREPDDLRSLNVVVAESDQCLFVNKEYMCAWSEQFSHMLSKNVQEISFPGGEAELQLILNAIWPNSKRLTVDQIVELLVPSEQWRMQPCLANTIAYYLHSNTTLTAAEKLKLASQSGNLLLLFGTLYYQCRGDTIFDVVRLCPDEWSHISEATHSKEVMKNMIELVAKESDLQHKESIGNRLHQELMNFKRRCSELFDFSSADEWRKTELVAEGKSFYVNKAYLSVWSPVFYQMFYGDFRDRKQQRIPISDTSAETLRLFLSLLHPSHMCAVWKLLPNEYVRNWKANQWIDDLYVIIFDENVDAVMDVFKLAHKYQINSLIDVCILIIETKSDYSTADKVLLADAYHLPTLMALCIAKLTTTRGIKRMLADNENLIPNLSCNAHRILLERMIDLV